MAGKMFSDKQPANFDRTYGDAGDCVPQEQYQTKTCTPDPTTIEDTINQLFSYHPPSFETNRRYETIREAAKYFAKVVLANTPPSADQTSAIRKLREAVMTANAAIALNGVTL